MPISSTFVPVIVAVIGIVGTLAPVYINNSISTDPKIVIQSTPGRSFMDNNTMSTAIINVGNAPATNLSLFLSSCGFDSVRPCEYMIHNITNGYSTADIVIPQFNNTSLEPGVPLTINRSLVEVQVAKLVQGSGSIINLMSSINNSYGLPVFEIYAVYDQGSIQQSYRRPLTFVESLPDYVVFMRNYYNEIIAPLFSFYVIFYAVFFVLLYRYIKRRKALKKLITGLTDNIMEVRGVLRNDLTNKDIIPETWFKKPNDMRRRAIKKLTDYLLIDDFYSELRKRNLYLSKNKDKEESGLSRGYAISKLNEALLTSAENALNRVDWDNYR